MEPAPVGVRGEETRGGQEAREGVRKTIAHRAAPQALLENTFHAARRKGRTTVSLRGKRPSETIGTEGYNIRSGGERTCGSLQGNSPSPPSMSKEKERENDTS